MDRFLSDEMSISNYLKWLGVIVVAVLGVTWIAQGNDFFVLKVFAPKYEAVRRETFEQSKAYNQGMVQELQNMQFEYVKADAAHKDASIILHRAADYDTKQLPPDLAQFIAGLRAKQMEVQP